MSEREPFSDVDMARSKVVGRRRVARPSLDDMARLVRTVVSLRGTPALVPRGVYRFRSFEEADAWMMEMIRRSHARRNPTTSDASQRR